MKSGPEPTMGQLLILVGAWGGGNNADCGRSWQIAPAAVEPVSEGFTARRVSAAKALCEGGA
jgi:hypothetical protein